MDGTPRDQDLSQPRVMLLNMMERKHKSPKQSFLISFCHCAAEFVHPILVIGSWRMHKKNVFREVSAQIIPRFCLEQECVLKTHRELTWEFRHNTLHRHFGIFGPSRCWGWPHSFLVQHTHWAGADPGFWSVKFWPQVGALSLAFAQNRGFSLKIPWELHDFEEIFGGKGGPGPQGPSLDPLVLRPCKDECTLTRW